MSYLFFLINLFHFKKFFQHEKNCGTKAGIFQSNPWPVDKNVLIGIGKPGTVGWPHFINTAPVIASEEGAGLLTHYIISFIIQLQVPVNEAAFLQAEVFTDAFYVRRFKAGGIIFTAGGAVQAVDMGKRFFVQFRKLFQHLIFISSLQHPGIGFLLGSRFFLPLQIMLCRCGWRSTIVFMRSFHALKNHRPSPILHRDTGIL